MHIERHDIAVTTSSGGAFTGYSDVVTGRVLQVRYVPHGSTPLDTGADVTITGEISGVPIATLSNIGTAAFMKVPRQATHGVTGTGLVYAGSDAVAEPVFVAGERIKLVVADGASVKSGTFSFWIG
jgi:hypothetical protein